MVWNFENHWGKCAQTVLVILTKRRAVMSLTEMPKCARTSGQIYERNALVSKILKFLLLGPLDSFP